MATTLHTYPNSGNASSSGVGPEIDFRTAKILIAARYSGKDCDLTLKRDVQFSNDGKLAPSFLSRFPLGKVPGLELTTSSASNNVTVSESNAAAYHLANEELRGGGEDAVNHTLVLQWMNLAEQDLIPAVFNRVFPLLGLLTSIPASNQQEEGDSCGGSGGDRLSSELVSLLRTLNSHLGQL